jgi:hypothetical protein
MPLVCGTQGAATGLVVELRMMLVFQRLHQSVRAEPRTEAEETEEDGGNGLTTEARSERRRTEAVTLQTACAPADGRRA